MKKIEINSQQPKAKNWFWHILLFALGLAFSPPKSVAQVAVCDNNPITYCQEQAWFHHSIIENFSTGQADIFANAALPAYFNYNHSYTLFQIVAGAPIFVAQMDGMNVHFVLNNPTGCYVIRHCIRNETQAFVCHRQFCFDKPPPPTCCELTLRFRTTAPQPVWDFGDQTSMAGANVTHTYHNVNTIAVNPIPVTLSTNLGGQATVLPMPTQVQPGIWVGNGCSTENINTVQNTLAPGTLLFPAATSSGIRISVEGTLDLNTGYTFSNCDICMNPSSRMQVSTTSTVTYNQMTNVHDAACKNASWFGIESTGTSAAITADNSTFTGAYNAIKTSTSGITTLRLTSNTFNRNYVGIFVNRRTTFAQFNGNTFGNEAAIMNYPNHSAACGWVTNIGKPILPTPYAGIYARPTVDGLANFGVVLPAGQLNTFANIANGIYMENANGTIRSCRFVNMLCETGYSNGLADDGYGVYFNTNNGRQLLQTGLGKTAQLTFQNCRHAVFAAVSNINSRIQCQQNRMEVQNGISIDAKQNGGFLTGSLLRNNDITYAVNPCASSVKDVHGIWVYIDKPNTNTLGITLNRVTTSDPIGLGIWLQSTAGLVAGTTDKVAVTTNTNGTDGIFNGQFGIRLENFTNALVENNKVNGFIFSGIDLRNARSNRIRCNSTSSSAGGFVVGVFSDASPSNKYQYNHTTTSNTGVMFNNACDNGIVECNTISGHSTGLFYQNATVGIQSLVGGSGFSNGNVWSNNGTDAFADPFTQITPNRYFFRTGEINTWNPPAWFQMVTVGKTCGTGCPIDEFTEETNTETDKAIAGNQVSQTGLHGYLLKRHLYAKLLQNPGLQGNDATINAFYQSYGGTTGGKITTVEHSLYNGLVLTASQQSQLEQALTNLDNATTSWEQLDDAVVSGTDPQTQAAQRDALNQQADAAMQTIQSIYAANLSARVSQSSQLAQTLNTIAPTDVWEVNDKTLDQLFLNTAFVDVIPNAGQLAQILAIANQCVADGGTAVNRARAWYYELTGQVVSVNCNGVNERGYNEDSVVKTNEKRQMLVSPNPTSGRILVQFPENTVSVERFEIYSLVTGGKIQSIKLSPDAKSVELETTALHNGNYVCKLIGEGQILGVSKFVVLK